MVLRHLAKPMNNMDRLNSSKDSQSKPRGILGSLSQRTISINTNMYYKENFWLYESTMETDRSS
jgi:sphingomyelin phosphodiesterase